MKNKIIGDGLKKGGNSFQTLPKGDIGKFKRLPMKPGEAGKTGPMKLPFKPREGGGIMRTLLNKSKK